ncbi:acyltransferase [Bradyrhizobium sp. cf659]|uniref:acyltransferase n=1 Tax=Bradyrhizobium sp. cf659 TaxID=1761771 RepID=UPI0008EA671C|nr:acyltransferase [Bradyrhizobium sp. cf659]SFK01579.1 Transferase family protein [Bradyrhizobium sp. cf659]
MIRCSAPIPLSAYDQSFGLAPSVIRVLSYRYVPDIERFNFALSRAFERFPQFATALARSQRGSSELVPLESPQRLIVRSPVIWDPDSDTANHLPLFVTGLDLAPGDPVFTATLTPVNGGAVIGLSMSHAVGDGYSFYLFMSYLLEQLAAAPPSRLSPEQQLDQIIQSNTPDARIASGQENFRVKREFSVIAFGREFLDSLRAELATDQFVPTLNEALTAFLVHRYGPTLLGGATALRLRVPVNVRNVHPNITRTFIGNAFLESIVPVADVIDSPLAARDTARRIHEAVNSVRNPDYLSSALHIRNDRIELSAPDTYIFNNQTDVVSTNYARMPVHTIDLGNGPPVRIFCALTAPTGFVLVPTFDGLEAHMCHRA